MKSVIPPIIIRQIFVLLLILLFAILIFKEIFPYLSGILGAITIYVLLRKWMVYLVKKKWKPHLAAAFLMFLSFVCILLPVAEKKWRDFVKEKSLTGVQLWSGKDFSFQQKYQINAIPRFILVDPNGNIVDANAPRPSEPRLKDLFTSLGI